MAFEVKNVGDRKHPDYKSRLPIWEFLLASYRGGMGMAGRTGISDAKNRITNGYFPGLFQWQNEDDHDYKNRVYMTPYRAYARKIVNSFSNFVFKDAPDRENADQYQQYIKDVDGKGTTLLSFLKSATALSRVFGEVNIMVDKPTASPDVITRQNEIDRGIRPYALVILPQQIVDWDYTSNGLYRWVLLRSQRMVNDPTLDKALIIDRRTYWDGEIWQTYEQDGKDWKLVAEALNPIGEVPIYRMVVEDIDNNPLTPESWFYDLADMNRAVYNMDAVSFENIYMQTFGHRILPGDGRDAEELKKASASTGWTETPEERGISRFIQPAGSNVETIAKEKDTFIREMYGIAGLQHRKEGRMAESAEAKEWDFQEVNQFLSDWAQSGQQADNQVLRLFGLWDGIRAEASAIYPTDFKIDELEQEIAAILGIKDAGGFQASDTGRKESLKAAYRLVLDVGDETMKTIETEIDASQDDPLAGMTIAPAQPTE